MIYLSFKTFKEAFSSSLRVIRLEIRWKDMNVDLSKLSEYVQDFFRKEGFLVRVAKLNDGYQLVVEPRIYHKIIENIYINIVGSSNDFVVRFKAGSKSHSFTLWGNLMSFLGGGFFAVKGFKSGEALDKLEREFRVFIAEKVWQLRKVV